MGEYKLCYLNHGRVERTEPLVALDDPTAIAVARHLAKGYTAELWRGTDRIETFTHPRLD